MRFGLLQMSPVPSGTWWTDRARRVEDLGFSTLLLSDHFDRSPVAPIAAMAAAAAVTERLTVGTLVLNNDLRHPAVLAKELATIALLSDGRLEIGLGAGWMLADYAQLGTVPGRGSQRIDRLAESVELLRALLADDVVTHRGSAYRVEGMRPVPAGVGAGVAIMIGGGGPKILALAGRTADIVSVNWNVGSGVMGDAAIASGSPEATDEKLGWIRAAAAGSDPEIHLHCYLLRCTDDPIGAVSSWLRQVGVDGADPRRVLESPHILAGPRPVIDEKLAALRSRWGISYVTFYDDALDDAVALIGTHRDRTT